MNLTAECAENDDETTFSPDVKRLGRLLVAAEVLGHPFVLGEIALGHLRRRAEVPSLFAALPRAEVARHDEV